MPVKKPKQKMTISIDSPDKVSKKGVPLKRKNVDENGEKPSPKIKKIEKKTKPIDSSVTTTPSPTIKKETKLKNKKGKKAKAVKSELMDVKKEIENGDNIAKGKKKEKENKKPKGDKKDKLKEKIKVKKEGLMQKDGTGEEKKELTKKEMRTKQKQLKEERRKKKDGSIFLLGIQAKKVWEEVRREDCPEDKRNGLLAELYKLVKGQVNKLVLAHDTSRVIECLVSLGDEKIREGLYRELKDDLIALMKSRYASFFVQKLIRHGTKEQKARVFKVLEGQVARLARHKVANSVLELCYNDYCNGQQRNHFLQEFFGPEFHHFKDDTSKNVLEFLAKQPEKRISIMKSLQENSNILLTKGCYNISLVHTVLYNYMLLLNSSSDEKTLKLRNEFVSQLRDVCVHVLHSHDGARLAMNAIWHGTAKDRKSIIKSFKGHVTKIANEEQGHLVLLALFDSVDDTKLVGKAVIGELASNLGEISSSKHGRDVLAYLMAPRSTVYFYPGTLDILKQGDGNVNSKKDTEIRRTELYEASAPTILKFILEHLMEIIEQSGPGIIMLQEILKSSAKFGREGGNEEIKTLFGNIFCLLAEETAKPFISGDASKNIVENPASHRLIKKLTTQDKENKSIPGCVLFSTYLAKALDQESIESYLECNRGCFVLVNLLETQIDEVVAKLLPLLKPLQGKMKKKMPGAEILKKKIIELGEVKS